jgi:PIN domain
VVGDRLPTVTGPLLWPCEGASGRSLLKALQHVRAQIDGLWPLSYAGAVVSYVGWATEAVAALRGWLTNEDVERLIRTPAYWAAVALPPGADSGLRLVVDELQARQQQLERVITSVEQAVERWGDDAASQLVIPDTNVLVHHREGIETADWHTLLSAHVRPMTELRLVLPLLIVDELEKRKDGKEPQRSRARHALKLLYGRYATGTDSRSLFSTSSRGTRVWLEILMEDPGHTRLPRADEDLLRTARRLQDLADRPVLFVTYDTGAALRAAAVGVSHLLLGQHD